jgi:formate hydrogenlyase subunit 6/NADH:ubiquinone oxidoreductase subunit I
MGMLRNVLDNLFTGPATRTQATRRDPVTDVRGTLVIDDKECIYCGACSLKCPADAIVVDRPEKLMTFDVFKCVACNSCVEACKKGCIQMQSAYQRPGYSKPDIHLHGAPVLSEQGK